jgi:hypothetical protein
MLSSLRDCASGRYPSSSWVRQFMYLGALVFLNRDAALHDQPHALLPAGNKPMPRQGFLLPGTELGL